MIDEIRVNKIYKTIPANFSLKLGKITVIAGKNNTGKTNFIKNVKDIKNVSFLKPDGSECKPEPEIVYIPAEKVVPSSGHWKSGASSSDLIKDLASLFTNLGIQFQIENKDTITDVIKNLADKATNNLNTFTSNEKEKHELELKINDGSLDSKVIVQALIEKALSKENGEVRDLNDLGQGTQRIVIAAILKAYLDIKIETGKIADRPVLILFEEPEIYLHPELKRTLNATLNDIASQDEHQVILTTHDPYFTFAGLDEPDSKLYSFIKKDGMTVRESGIISGIEDELLFILLYQKLGKNKIVPKDVDAGFTARIYKCFDGKTRNYSALEYVRHQIHHSGDNDYTAGRVEDSTKVKPGHNYYTTSELSSSIKGMSAKLSA